jgi:hypothetical protein
MRPILNPVLSLLAVSGCNHAPSREATLMDEIERSVVLPKSAEPLSAYGRNYAFADQGRVVVATYLIPSPPIPVGKRCQVMLANGSLRPCTKEQIAEQVSSDARAAAAETPAGRRRWFRTPNDLPYISDGGCQQVDVQFDIASHRILAVACNGIA